MPDNLMTTREVADLLKLDISSVSRLLRQGKLKGERLSSVWLVDKQSVQTYLKATKDLATTSPKRGLVTSEDVEEDS